MNQAEIGGKHFNQLASELTNARNGQQANARNLDKDVQKLYLEFELKKMLPKIVQIDGIFL